MTRPRLHLWMLLALIAYIAFLAAGLSSSDQVGRGMTVWFAAYLAFVGIPLWLILQRSPPDQRGSRLMVWGLFALFSLLVLTCWWGIVLAAMSS